MDREWKDVIIKNKETRYIISTNGEIIDTETGRLLSVQMEDGYLACDLYVGKKKKSINVAKLMMKIFKDRVKQEGEVLCFLDENRLNLNIENLEYKTMEEFYNFRVDKMLHKINDTDFALKEKDIEDEIWRPVVFRGITTKYIVSSKSRLMNVLTGIFIRPVVTNGSPYPKITLYVNDKKHTVRMHRLVAWTFLEKPDDKNLINHKDENKENYSIENLEWCDNAYNVRYSLKNRAKNKDSNRKGEDINEETVTTICELLEVGHSIKDIAKELNLTKDQIEHVVYGSTWNHITKHYHI